MFNHSFKSLLYQNYIKKCPTVICFKIKNQKIIITNQHFHNRLRLRTIFLLLKLSNLQKSVKDFRKQINQYSHKYFRLTIQMKRQGQNKSQMDSVKSYKYPSCLNKKQARMVCLNESCQNYAFFCLQCEDQSCEQKHRHENKADKYISISFKQFVRRVLKQRKPSQELQFAISTYRQTLERLRRDINEFVQKQLKNLDEIIERAVEVGEDLLPLVKRLKEEKYEGLIGKEMDYLWKNCGESLQSLKMQKQTSQFIRIKQEELKAISEHFQNLNKIEIDKLEVSKDTQNPKSPDTLNQPNRSSPSPALSSNSKAGQPQNSVGGKKK